MCHGSGDAQASADGVSVHYVSEKAALKDIGLVWENCRRVNKRGGERDGCQFQITHTSICFNLNLDNS